MNYFIRNATLVTEGKVYQASVLIENGIIKKIVPPHRYVKTDAKIINAVGLFLLPGVIDSHVHFRDPGFTHKGDFESESKAAVAGGITSVIDMPNTNPQTTSEKELDAKIELISGKSWTNFGFMVGATNENIKEITSIPQHKFAAIKLFLGASTGNMLVNNETAVKELFKKSKKVIVSHCEDEDIINKNTELVKEKYGDNPPASVHSLIRDVDAAYQSTKKAIAYAEKGNAHLHIAHLSTAKELELLQKVQSKKITAEACVNYLWFDDSDYEKFGNKLKCNPAIKSAEDKNALIKGLNSKVLHTIGTDHAPHTPEEKAQSYFSSPSGIPSIQFSLQMMFELYQQGLISLETIVEKMCHNPAKLFRIQNRGFIKEGYVADLVLVDFNSTNQVKTEDILYKCKWSLLEDYTFRSKICATFVNGEIAFEEGKIVGEKRGKALNFD
ncbi:dihydroorotase [Bacteroidales bacterium OttesenSCG-928-C19]|nr:dihydroorotase [Bacteroidales bacterium OttesenSCG-928-C19]